ncbi:MAG: hypothetical protein DI535_04435 [Citrobacter freundii]|nr:MAG: hypothetical protein DI535_04435 [Citrobacter freundii]
MKNDQHKHSTSPDKKSSTVQSDSSIEGKKNTTTEWKTNTTTHPKMLALHDGFGSKDFDRFYKNIKVVIEDH